jgi:hypothetical protein
MIEVVMAGHGRSKNGVGLLAYVPAHLDHYETTVPALSGCPAQGRA